MYFKICIFLLEHMGHHHSPSHLMLLLLCTTWVILHESREGGAGTRAQPAAPGNS